MDELDILFDNVTDRHTFLIFVKALMEDKIIEDSIEENSPSSPYSAGARGWENNTIANYLESCIAWTEDSLGQKMGLPETPSWQSFAAFLYAGKFYE